MEEKKILENEELAAANAGEAVWFKTGLAFSSECAWVTSDPKAVAGGPLGKTPKDEIDKKVREAGEVGVIIPPSIPLVQGEEDAIANGFVIR